MRGPVIIALDVDNQTELMDFLQKFPKQDQLTVKIGMELFYGEGPELVKKLHELNYHIFLDLKLHDIPNTVRAGMKQIAQLGIDMTTVHALGGAEMIAAAKEGLVEGSKLAGVVQPKLLAVTELTSISDDVLKNEQNCKLDMKDQVVSLAKTAKKAGADGVITSPLEVEALRKQVGTDFLYVTPGIRPKSAQSNDQKRIATPEDAAKFGSSALVVGRPIVQAADPVASYHNILEAWQNA